MSKRALDLDNLRRLVRVVAAVLDGLPAVDHNRYASHAEHRRAAEAALDGLVRREGARWHDSGANLTVMLGGIRASSTMGAAAALRNWRTSAHQKIGGAA